MRALSILGGGALMLALGGCGTSDTVKKVGAMADRACACRDAACADAVDKEYWELVKTNPKGTQDERDEAKQHYDRMRECIVRARSASPGGGPAAPAPAGAEPAGASTGAATPAAGAAGTGTTEPGK
jgi:hypothetical protein